MNVVHGLVRCFLTFGFICGCMPGQPAPKFTCSAAYTDRQVLIDGLLDDSLWYRAQKLILTDNQTGDSIRDTSILTTVRTGYDKQNLYVAFICNDPDIWSSYTSKDQHLWNNEVVEVFIDTDSDPNTYVEIEISPRNVLFDSFIIDPENIDFEETARFDLADIHTAVTVNGTLDVREDRDWRWIVEISVPLKCLDKKLCDIYHEKMRWKINYFRINRDKGKRTGEYAWSPTNNGFHVPTRFGVLTFENKNPK
jgi:hypothetical protein